MAPMLTVAPSEPAGQVPIGGWSAAIALCTKLNGAGSPADSPADNALRLAPVATA